MFTAVNGILLQTVSVREPGRLVRFNHVGRNDRVRNSNDYGYSGTSGTRNVRSTFSFPMIEELRAANTTLTGLAAGAPMGNLNVLVDGDARLGHKCLTTATVSQLVGHGRISPGVPVGIGFSVFPPNDPISGATALTVLLDGSSDAGQHGIRVARCAHAVNGRPAPFAQRAALPCCQFPVG